MLKSDCASTDTYKFAREALWAAGFEIDCRYLSADLDQMDRSLFDIFRIITPIFSEDGRDELASDRIAGLDHFSGVIAKARKRVMGGQFAGFVNDTAKIAVGEFDEFHPVVSDGEDSAHSIYARALDFEASARDEIHGKRLKLWDALEATLADISCSMRDYRTGNFTNEEILTARDDVRNGFKAIVCFYQATTWIYGQTAFGLRMAAFTGEQMDYSTLLRFTILFARLSLLPHIDNPSIADNPSRRQRQFVF